MYYRYDCARSVRLSGCEFVRASPHMSAQSSEPALAERYPAVVPISEQTGRLSFISLRCLSEA